MKSVFVNAFFIPLFLWGRLSGVLTVINVVFYTFAVELVVGFDDTLDELMADDVLFLEFDFADSLHAFQDLHGLYESGSR